MRLRGRGPSARIPISSTTTWSTRAGTSPPGSSRSCSRKRSARASGGFGRRSPRARYGDPATPRRPDRPSDSARLDHSGARQRPDHPDVEGDHEDRPEGVVGDEEEVRDGAEAGEHDRCDDGPPTAREQAPAGGHERNAEQQMHPPPDARVEVERVVLGDDEELVVEDRRQAGDDLEAPDEREDAGGEHYAARRPTRRFITLILRTGHSGSLRELTRCRSVSLVARQSLPPNRTAPARVLRCATFSEIAQSDDIRTRGIGRARRRAGVL